ncbi:MAG: tRNA methyltransferase [Rhizobiales bacterium]|nr:tRNA methyltransferase [Hyphomicrobiales bacterium]
MVRVALFQPDIPQNAGTILRMGACLGVGVDIIEPAGFRLSDAAFRRAGLDYLTAADWRRHGSFEAFEAVRRAEGRRLVLLSTTAETTYTDFEFGRSDTLMVGRESSGVPPHVHAAADARVRIALAPGMRSLNVAVALAMVLGEALRVTRAVATGGGH